MTAHDVIDAMYSLPTLVFGHRGAKAYAPMNTIPSFELAADQGAHGIELDVHRSKDGHAVIVHDFVVDATSDGTGLVVEKTLAELKALDAGAWFDARFAGTRIPTLDEVFEAVGRRVFVNVEIKSESADSDGVEQVVADCITRHNMAQRVILSSFNPLTLRRFRALLPDVPAAFLYESESPANVWELLGDTPYEAYHPYDPEVTPELIAQHAERGRVLNVWTVNDAERAVALCAMGVRGIITDTPDVILKRLYPNQSS